MKLFRDEEGQTLVFSALCMTALLGFLAMAIDVGLLFRARRNLQIAADGAATAAALDYYYNKTSSGAVTAADGVGASGAALNGVTAGNGTTVDVHCPVVNGPYASGNCNGYFEAILTQPNPSFIMGMFTGSATANVSARAVAGTPYVANYCVYVLNSSGNVGNGGGNNGAGVDKGSSDMFLNGSFTVNANRCGIVINGTGNQALNLNGSGGTLNAGSIAIVGGCTGCGSIPYSAGVAPVTNPLKSLCVPEANSSPCAPPSACISGGSFGGTASTPLVIGNGGTVCYSGDSNGNLTLTNVTINGTFIFNGAGTLTWGGNVNSDGTNGATIDLAYPTTYANNKNVIMTENAGTVFNLSAPTSSSSPYQGVVLMAPPDNYGIVTFEFGNSHGSLTGTVNGVVYLPSATLYSHDSGGGTNGLTLNTDLIVGQIDDNTATLTINSYSNSNPTLTPLRAVALVE